MKSNPPKIPVVNPAPTGCKTSKVTNAPIITVNSGVKNVWSISGIILRICFSSQAKNIPAISAANSPPAAGLYTFSVKGRSTSALLNLVNKGIPEFAIHIAPANAPRIGEPLNSFAAFMPTKIGKYANSAQPIVLIHSYHHIPLKAPFDDTLITLHIPLIRPAAIIPGNSGTKILAILLKNLCTGWFCIAFLSALFSLASSSAVGSSAVPKGIPVSSANSAPIFSTFPGPRTTCRVSDSTTPKTPSILFIVTTSTLDASLSLIY